MLVDCYWLWSAVCVLCHCILVSILWHYHILIMNIRPHLLHFIQPIRNSYFQAAVCTDNPLVQVEFKQHKHYWNSNLRAHIKDSFWHNFAWHQPTQYICQSADRLPYCWIKIYNIFKNISWIIFTFLLDVGCSGV